MILTETPSTIAVILNIPEKLMKSQESDELQQKLAGILGKVTRILSLPVSEILMVNFKVT